MIAMRPLLRAVSTVLLATAVLPAARAQLNIPGITLPGACPPNTSCVPGTPPLIPPHPPGTCGPGSGGPTCGGSGPASANTSSTINVGAGNPINVITGNKYQREVDMPALPGVLGLEIVRHYNSAFSGPGGSTNLVGRGWKLSYETELSVTGKTLQIVQADGTRRIFNRDPANPSLCASTNPADGTLTIASSGKGEAYLWRWTDGRELRFDAKGKLAQIMAADGQFLSLQYDHRGMLVSVTDPQGRRLHLSYPDKETARAGETFRGVQRIDSPVGQFNYVYGSPAPAPTVEKALLRANLVKVVSPQGARYYHYEDARFPTLLTGISALAGSAWQRVATYGYDVNGKGNLTVKGAPARLARGADGQLLQPARLVPGTGIEQVTLDTGTPGQTTIRNSLGQDTVYRHAIIGGQFRLLEVRGAGCAACGESNMRYGYDQLGRLISSTRITPAGVPLSTVLTELDREGRTVKVSRIAYVNGKPAPAQWESRYEYAGSEPQATLIARPSVVAGKEMQTRMNYNGRGQLLDVTVSGWSPDPLHPGQATPIVRTTAYRYSVINGRSLLTAIEGPLANGKPDAAAGAGVTRIDYDPKGNHVVALHAPGNVLTTITARDEAGRPSEVSVDDGARLLQTRSAYTAQGQLQSMVQSAWLLLPASGQQGPVRDEASKLERKLEARYDAAGQLTALRLPAYARDIAPAAATGRPEPATLEAGLEQQALLEAQLRRGPAGSSAERDVLEIFRHGDSSGAPVARRWLDDFGRLVALQYEGQGITRAYYVEQGPDERVDRLVDALGTVTRLVYDVQGRVSELSRTTADGKLAERLAYRYAGSWPVEQIKFKGAATDSAVATRYNAFGQVVAETTRSGSLAMTVNQAYDSAGRNVRTWISDGAGGAGTAAVNLHYRSEPDMADQIASIEAGEGWFGKRTVVSALQWMRTRTPGGKNGADSPVLAGWRTGNGLQVSSQIETLAGTGSAPAWRLRAYQDGVHDYRIDGDGAGRISAISQVRTRLAAVSAPAWHLLPQAQAAEAPAAAAGDASATAAAPASADAPAGQAHERDPAGRWRAIDGEQGRFTLSWDSAGNLASVAHNGAEVASYQYDAQGRRIAKRVSGHPELERHFLYSGKQLLAEADRDGRILRQYVYVGWRPVAWLVPARSLMERVRQVWSGPAMVTLHTDPRGAVTAATGDDQAVLWDARVDANGNAVSTGAGAFEQPLRLVNQYADAETGLSYNLARYYDPRSGAFISPDPAGLGSGSLDLYAYAGGDPLNHVDPDGWATIQYFAIDSGTKAGANLQPDAGRWAFIITGIAGHLDQTFIYDRGGSYLGAGKNYDLITQAPGTTLAATAFGNFYNNKSGFYSPAAFTREMSDANASGLIESLTGTKLGDGTCPANLNSVLPAIPLGVQGTLTPTAAPGADPARLISCPAGTSAADILERRMQKAVEIHEVKSSDAKATDKDCSTATYLGCAANTWNPALKPGTETVQPASYGWTQFTPLALVDALNGLPAADLTTLGITAAQRTDLATKVKGVQKWYDKLVHNGSPDATTVDKGWDQNKDAFIADTGLAKRDYDRMVSFGEIGATLKEVNTTYKKTAANPTGCTDSPCFWTKWGHDNPTAKAALLAKASSELGATQVRLNPYIRNLALMGEGRAGFQWAAMIASPIGQSLLSALSDKAKADLLAKSFLNQKLKKARHDLNLTNNNNLTAAQELSVVTAALTLQNGSATYPPKVLPHFKTTFCLEGTAKSTNGYLRMDQLKVIK